MPFAHLELVHQHRALLEAGHPAVFAVAVVCAGVLGGRLVAKDSRAWPLEPRMRIKILLAVAFGGLVGCAIPAYFAGEFVAERAFQSLLGPKTILGGLLGGFLGASLFKRIVGEPYDTSDAFARGTCLMMAIGRIGCVAQHCCFGVEVAPRFGFDFGDGVSRFPVQALESALLFTLFGLVHRLHVTNRMPGRRLFAVFVVYGSLRFGLEFLREPIASQALGLGFYQWLALGMVVVGLFRIALRTARSTGQGPVLRVDA